jgi:MFS superfamily sulfate permease-like transporter
VKVPRSRRDEFWIATIRRKQSASGGVEQGILISIAISVIAAHLRVSYHPPALPKISLKARSVVEVPVVSEEMAFPGMMIYRFNAPLYYANSDFFMQEVLRLVKNAKSQVKWLSPTLTPSRTLISPHRKCFCWSFSS